MPRKSIQELIAQATADFPDNVTGLITPAKLRGWAIDFLNSIAPAFGYLTITSANGQVFGLTPALVVMQTPYTSDTSQVVAAVPASTVTKQERGNVTINFTIDIETNNGRFITFTVYKDGVATPWRVTGNGAGAGNPVAVSLTAIDYTPTPNTVYDIRATAEVAGTSVILSNGGFVVQVDPVRDFT